MELNCDQCSYYRYIRCYGNDCFHPAAPELPEGCDLDEDTLERGDEPLAENRHSGVPRWCPLTRN